MQWIVMGLVAVSIICVAWDMYTERKARDDADSKLQVMDLKLTEARERAKRTVRELEQLKTRVNIIDEVQRVHSEEIDELAADLLPESGGARGGGQRLRCGGGGRAGQPHGRGAGQAAGGPERAGGAHQDRQGRGRLPVRKHRQLTTRAVSAGRRISR